MYVNNFDVTEKLAVYVQFKAINFHFVTGYMC